MVKVRTSQIPEDSPIRKVTKKLSSKREQHHEEERDDIDLLLDNFEPDEEDKKSYFKTLITFPELSRSINPSYIQSIEKTFRLKESNSNFEAEFKPEYGILINCGVISGMNSPKGDIELWYKDENFRDQRYDKLMKTLDEVGIKVITI